MLNSSGGLIGNAFSIDWQSGGTGKQNISQQAGGPTAMLSKVVYVDIVFCSLWQKEA